MGAVVVYVDIFDIDTIQGDAASSGRVETNDQREDRALAAAAIAYDGRDLVFVGAKAHMIQSGCLAIAQTHILKAKFLGIGRKRECAASLAGRKIYDGKDSLTGCDGVLELVVEFGDMLDGSVEHEKRRHEREKLPRTHMPLDHLPSAYIDHQSDDHSTQALHQRAHQLAGTHLVESEVEKLLVVLGKALKLSFFQSFGLDQFDIVEKLA